MAKTMRKVRTGRVVRTRMDKTAVVEMVWKQRHRLYQKQVRRVARFQVHDPLNSCFLGDVVRIEEVRPISKTKRWRLVEILERHQVAQVTPMELESDAEVAALPEQTGQEEAGPEAVAEPEDAEGTDEEELSTQEEEEQEDEDPAEEDVNTDETEPDDDEDLEDEEGDQELVEDEGIDESGPSDDDGTEAGEATSEAEDDKE